HPYPTLGHSLNMRFSTAIAIFSLAASSANALSPLGSPTCIELTDIAAPGLAFHDDDDVYMTLVEFMHDIKNAICAKGPQCTQPPRLRQHFVTAQHNTDGSDCELAFGVSKTTELFAYRNTMSDEQTELECKVTFLSFIDHCLGEGHTKSAFWDGP